jgi:hypothetical protein
VRELGLLYLRRDFPKLDHIETARLVEPASKEAP